MTETASQLSVQQGGLPPASPSLPAPPAAEAVKNTLAQPQGEEWTEEQLGQAQPVPQEAQQTTAKAKVVGSPHVQQVQQVQKEAELMMEPWTELSEMPCVVTSPRVSNSHTTSLQQRSRLSYEQWLVAKNKADAQQRRRQRREQQRQRHEQLQRQQLAEQSFKLWLKGKRRQQSLPRVAAGSAVTSDNKAPLHLDMASHRHIELWQRRKVAEMTEQREWQQQRREQQQMRNELRRKLSDLAFERWLAQSAVKRQLNLGTWRSHLQQQKQPQQTNRQQQKQRQQLRHKAAAEPYSLYLHVPLSAAQQALRDRMQDVNVVGMQNMRRS